MKDSSLRLGLVGRADGGGLAALTYEVARHLHPDRTLVMDLGQAGRGPSHPERYEWGDVTVNHGYNDDLSVDTVRRFCHGLELVYTAECTYREDFCDIARSVGCRTILHSMPELYRKRDAQPDAVWVPTDWRLDLVPDAPVIPVPVPTDTFAPKADRYQRAIGRNSFLHLCQPAFHDRAGTDLAYEAAMYLDRPARIVVAGGRQPPPASFRNRRGTQVDFDWQPGLTYDRRDVYPRDCGALLAPRRYGGLSLPFLEAAALGWPIVSLDLEPQNEWLPKTTLAPALPANEIRMVGGWVTVYDANPRRIAERMTALVTDDQTWDEAVTTSEAYAAEMSWDRWQSRYIEALEAVVA